MRTARLSAICVLMVTALCAATGVILADPPADPAASSLPLKSGIPPGDKVPQFYVRAVTGPLANKSVCYVCRNGDRPVVMILVREIAPRLAPLLKGIERIIDQQRAVGLRGFAVLLAEDQQSAVSKLQTFAFDAKLSLPLATAGTQLEGASQQRLHPEAAVTIILYRDRHVVDSFAYRSDELSRDAIGSVLEQVRSFATASAADPVSGESAEPH